MATQRLRIAVLNRQFSPTGGGAERYAIALVEHLAAHHDIHVFAQQIDHQWPGVTYHRVSQVAKRPRWFNQLWFATATWWATRRGFDVVHSHENTWHGQVQTIHVVPIKYNLFRGRTGVRLALRWLKVVTSPRLLVYLLLERSRFLRDSNRTIVVTSSSLIEQTARAYPECRSAIKVLTPGVDKVRGGSTLQQQGAARQRLGLPLQGQCILWVGNDYHKKGLPALMAALPDVPEDCFLAVVGNTAQIPPFKAQVVAAGLERRIHFLGSRKDMHDVYAAADCLVHPTLEDTFAMVVLEAMAHGLPVIVSQEKYCGIAGLLKSERQALILEDPTNAEALSAALRRLLAEPELRQTLVQAGLEFAKCHLWASVARQQEQIYQELLDQRPAR